MTPFVKVGYSKYTKFKVICEGFVDLKIGDIVTLYLDDGSKCPVFITEDGRKCDMYLPRMVPKGFDEELEVYEEPKSDPKKYEYTIENYTHELLTTEELLDNLNKEGINGWELCGTVGSKFIYKREV